ncbi:unnamed protein product [Victoria cruziana]
MEHFDSNESRERVKIILKMVQNKSLCIPLVQRALLVTGMKWKQPMSWCLQKPSFGL